VRFGLILLNLVRRGIVVHKLGATPHPQLRQYPHRNTSIGFGWFQFHFGSIRIVTWHQYIFGLLQFRQVLIVFVEQQ
jgi:hypothetical protein